MKLEDWPLYVTDSGYVQCYYDICMEEWHANITRRTSFGEVKKAIILHAREVHNIELV